jgi:hypothetical protein
VAKISRDAPLEKVGSSSSSSSSSRFTCPCRFAFLAAA